MSLYTISADRITDSAVHNQHNEELGKIEDVMINIEDGSIAYLVLSHGGVFGTTWADKRFAVPFNAVAVEQKGKDEVTFLLPIDKSVLENAPGFDKDNYPNFASPQFGDLINNYYRDYQRVA